MGQREKARYLAVLATTIALGSAVAVMIEYPPGQWLRPRYDTISIVAVFILALCALIAWALAYAHPLSRMYRFAVAGLSGVALWWSVAAVYPLALKGPMAEVAPFIFTDFLPRITEAKPAFSNGPIYLAAVLMQPMIALGLCIVSWRNPAHRFYAKEHAPEARAFDSVCDDALPLAATLELLPAPAHDPDACPDACWFFMPEHAAMVNRWPAVHLLRRNPRQQRVQRMGIVVLLIGLPLLLFVANNHYENTHNRLNMLNK